MKFAEAIRADETIECQIAHATLRLRRFRAARDRARAKRLEQAPYLATLIAAMLNRAPPKVAKH